MKICAAIPARLNSRRVKEKLLIQVGGKSIIQHTVDRVRESGLNKVFVVSDTDLICPDDAQTIVNETYYKNGTARICGNLDRIDPSCSYILVVLGDQPLLNPEHIKLLIERASYINGFYPETINTLITPCRDIGDKSTSKVIVNINNEILHFSRQPIGIYQHVSLVLIPRSIIGKYNEMEPSFVQYLEDIEWIIFLYNGYRIKAHFVHENYPDLNTPEDLEQIKNIIEGGKHDIS